MIEQVKKEKEKGNVGQSRFESDKAKTSRIGFREKKDKGKEDIKDRGREGTKGKNEMKNSKHRKSLKRNA